MQIHEAEALLTYMKCRLEDYVDDLCRDEGDIERIAKVVDGAYFILNDLESTLDMQCACDLSKHNFNR